MKDKNILKGGRKVRGLYFKSTTLTSSSQKMLGRVTPIKLISLLLLLFMGVAAWFFVAGNNKPRPSFSNSWIFKENQTGPIIGDLGGIPVSIPKPYARFVEYEHDPHFLKPRKGEPPKRSYQSKFRSFGFEFRYPDMAALTNKTRQEKRQYTIYNTMWMDAGVKVASYHDELSMQRLVDAIQAKKWGNGQYGYKQLSDTLYGLVVNEVYGFDDAKRDLIPGNSILDSNIYYHVNNKGEIENYIKCSNIRHDAAPCRQYFTLNSVNHTQVSVGYRIGFLPQWQKIQLEVTNLILNFAVEIDTIQP